MSEVLFALTMDKSYNTTDVAQKLEGIQDQGLEQYYDESFLQDHIQRLRANDTGEFSFSWYPHNAPGEWMSQNIDTSSTVISQPATVEMIATQLEQEKPRILVIASYLGGYSAFKAISEYVRRESPETKIVSASVGALLDETKELADYTIKGDQVTDLKKILGESEQQMNPVTVKAETTTNFKGESKVNDFGLLISSLGCPYGCDFCPSTAQFGKKFVSPFSAEQIRDKIISAKERISPESDAFTLSLAEPQGMGDVQLWKEIFKVTKDLPFICDLVTTTSSKIIQKFNSDELTQGDLRVTTVNIGVESLIQGYLKNKNVDLKRVIRKLQDSGISVVSTFIVGFDWQNKSNISQEVELLSELESDGYIIANLEMQPGTPLYNARKKEGRLLDVPPHLLNFYGFQAFEHPDFKSGFNDMLPILADIEDELVNGDQVFSAGLKTYLNRTGQQEAAERKQIQKKIEAFKDSLDPAATTHQKDAMIEQFASELYFKNVFRQMDLFHPFILSTN